ncbi:MAG TPA: RloB family protein [Bryobacteraceae bacterium]|nr:RloB family protein [Bryobacteraceae bacterium]
MARNRNDLQRRKPQRQPKPRFLIVCEGTVTEPRYFNDVRHIERSLIDLQIEPGGTPKTLVERAAGLQREAIGKARKLRDDNQKYEEVWCVFDIDEHPLIPEAKNQARANGIELAISNPCFELWVLLHFQDQRAHIGRGKVQHLCRSHVRNYDKELDYETLRPKYPDALKRAEDLERWHDSRDTVGANPSTTVYRLVERIKTSSH